MVWLTISVSMSLVAKSNFTISVNPPSTALRRGALWLSNGFAPACISACVAVVFPHRQAISSAAVVGMAPCWRSTSTVEVLLWRTACRRGSLSFTW